MIDNPFSDLETDTVSILKKDGTKIEDIKASVGSNQIGITRNDIVIESDDIVQQNLSNGSVVTYKVIDPGFQEAFHGIPAGYVMKVKKLGLPEAEQAVKNITYNIHGPNARVNYHSIDKSTNIVHLNQTMRDNLAILRKSIDNSSIDDTEKRSAHELVDEAERQLSSSKPSKGVVSALLNGLPVVKTIAETAKTIIDLIPSSS
jgi:methionine synthase II (cobalamin-independent)